MENDVIILGMGPSRCDCQFDAPYIYSCNTGYVQVAEMEGQISHIFLAHTQVKRADGKNVFNWDDFNFLASKGVAVYNTHKVKGLNSLPYPLKRISRKFKSNYFSDTIAYMVAFAIDFGTDEVDGKIALNGKVKKLRFYGVDMHEFGEYGLEKGGVEFWIGYAMALGMEVEISVGSTLMRTVTGLPYGTRGISRKQLLKGTPWEGKRVKEDRGFIVNNPEDSHVSLVESEIEDRKKAINDRKDIAKTSD